MAATGSLQAAFDWRKNITCRYFIHGLCREGDLCPYAHNRSHNNAKTNVCRYYLQGKCHYGDTCKFFHVAPTNDQKTNSSSSSTPAPVSAKVCEMESQMTALHLTGPKVGPGGEACHQGGVAYNRYSMKDLIDAKEFVPGQPFQGTLPPTYSQAAKKTGESDALVICSPESSPSPSPRQSLTLCPYAVKGICRYGDKCLYMHGEICDLCGEACLLPFDPDQKRAHRETCLKKHEKEMQEAFLYQQSKDIVCGICMEVVMEKSPRERKFGILSNCVHPYCLDCIRKWRSGKQFDKPIIRGCPTCRKQSHFVTPSDYWVEDPDEKKKLIENYIGALNTKACKYFDQGRGKCPFGADCFYLHAYPDGTKEDRSKVRHCRSSGNKIKDLRPTLLWEFFEQRNGLYDFGSDDEDFFLFGSSLWHDEWEYFSEMSEADDWLDYLQYMGSDDESDNDYESDWSGEIVPSGGGEENVAVGVEEAEEDGEGDGEVDADDEWEEGNEEEAEEVGVVEEEEDDEVGSEGDVGEAGEVVSVLSVGIQSVVLPDLVQECGYSEEDSQYSDCVDW